MDHLKGRPVLVLNQIPDKPFLVVGMRVMRTCLIDDEVFSIGSDVQETDSRPSGTRIGGKAGGSHSKKDIRVLSAMNDMIISGINRVSGIRWCHGG
jgi:hypothetical protein